MRRALAVLVPLSIALLALSLVGGTAGQTAPDGQTAVVATHENATSYLTMAPDAVEATDYASVGLDVGLEVGLNGRRLQTEHELRTLRQRVEAAESAANASDAFDGAIAYVQRRTAELYARTNGTIASYAAGSIEVETLLRERAAISAEADRLQSAVEEIESVAGDSLSFELTDEQSDRLGGASGRLALLQGPISDRAARLAEGGSSPQRVYAESSSTGYAFALTNGNTYVRETYLGDEYAPNASDQFAGIERVLQRATELYPNTSSEGVSGLDSTNVYRYNAGFDGGVVTVYLDGGTTNAFKEGLRLNASRLRVAALEETTNGTVALRINRTFPTGPMEVSLVDTATNATLDGAVTVNGRPVGRTGADGSLWAVEPRGDVTVEATTSAVSLSVSLATTEPTVQGG